MQNEIFDTSLLAYAQVFQVMSAPLGDLASNRQAPGDLQKEAARSASNTTDGKGGTDLVGPDSTSTITENGGFVK